MRAACLTLMVLCVSACGTDRGLPTSALVSYEVTRTGTVSVTSLQYTDATGTLISEPFPSNSDFWMAQFSEAASGAYTLRVQGTLAEGPEAQLRYRVQSLRETERQEVRGACELEDRPTCELEASVNVP